MEKKCERLTQEAKTVKVDDIRFCKYGWGCLYERNSKLSFHKKKSFETICDIKRQPRLRILDLGINGSEEGHKNRVLLKYFKSEPGWMILESLIKNELGWLAVASSRMRGGRKIISKDWVFRIKSLLFNVDRPMHSLKLLQMHLGEVGCRSRWNFQEVNAQPLL